MAHQGIAGRFVMRAEGRPKCEATDAHLHGRWGRAGAAGATFVVRRVRSYVHTGLRLGRVMTCVFGMLQTAACDQEQIAMTSRLPDDEPSCTCAGVLGASRLESGSAEHKSAVFTEKTRSVPFKAGDLGYAYFRIPALVSLASGRLLLVVEGRRDSAQDYGQIDLVQTMSDDGGVTWTSPQVIAHGDGRASTGIHAHPAAL